MTAFPLLLRIPLPAQLLPLGVPFIVQAVYPVFQNLPLIFPSLFHLARTVTDPIIDVLLFLRHRVPLGVRLCIELSVSLVSSAIPIFLGPVYWA